MLTLVRNIGDFHLLNEIHEIVWGWLKIVFNNFSEIRFLISIKVNNNNVHSPFLFLRTKSITIK